MKFKFKLTLYFYFCFLKKLIYLEIEVAVSTQTFHIITYNTKIIVFIILYIKQSIETYVYICMFACMRPLPGQNIKN